MALADWHGIGSDNWRYSLHRMAMFRQLEYERVVYMDADAVMVQSPAPLFELGYDLAAVVDQWDGCQRREVMNGGLLVFRPSLYLFHQLMSTFYSKPSCISGNMQFSDQELINCVCGFGGPARGSGSRDLTCSLLPSWTSTFPPETACPGSTCATSCPCTTRPAPPSPGSGRTRSASQLPRALGWMRASRVPALPHGPARLPLLLALPGQQGQRLAEPGAHDCELVMWNNDTQQALAAASRSLQTD